MNYASLNASLEQKPVQNKPISLAYNKNPTRVVAPASTAENIANTIMLRDSNRTTNISNINVSSKLRVSDGATISGGAIINGTLKINGAVDTSLGAGIVCSNGIGILSTRLITSADISNLSIKSEDIKQGAITTDKLAPNLYLAGIPTCSDANICNENQIANISYVNKHVTKYVKQQLHLFQLSGSIQCCDGDGDEDEFDPSIYHIKTTNYIVDFKFLTYVVENPTAIINMPRVKKEGYCVKFHNKSGDTIFINSSLDRLMYNTWYSPNGTISQAIENNRCVIFSYVYVGNVRSWSYQCF